MNNNLLKIDTRHKSNDQVIYGIEVCVETFEQALSAQEKGACQIELCSRLDLDGLTPSISNIELCLKELSILTKVLIRPKAGGFIYSKNHRELIQLEIEVCKDLGVTEVVIGLIRPDHHLDIEALCRLRDIAYPMEVSIHKAIDACIDVREETQLLINAGGFKSILSSGGKPTAWQGRAMLKDMIAIARNRIDIIPAGKIVPQNISKVHDAIGAKTYHGRNILGPL